jgi:cell pole-organizing protein PopZ
MTGGETTLDSLMRSLLEPMLQRWLDANLPEIVEKVAQAEIRRLTGRD